MEPVTPSAETPRFTALTDEELKNLRVILGPDNPMDGWTLRKMRHATDELLRLRQAQQRAQQRIDDAIALADKHPPYCTGCYDCSGCNDHRAEMMAAILKGEAS